MTNKEIIKLLRDLQWSGYTDPDGMVWVCQGCGVTHSQYEHAPRHEKKHEKGCRINLAIRQLQGSS